MSRYKFPFICNAAKRSRCPETGKAVHKGDLCAYWPTDGQAFHKSSQAYRDLEAMAAVDSADISFVGVV